MTPEMRSESALGDPVFSRSGPLPSILEAQFSLSVTSEVVGEEETPVTAPTPILDLLIVRVDRSLGELK